MERELWLLKSNPIRLYCLMNKPMGVIWGMKAEVAVVVAARVSRDGGEAFGTILLLF